jgi:hypothetical protein
MGTENLKFPKTNAIARGRQKAPQIGSQKRRRENCNRLVFAVFNSSPSSFFTREKKRVRDAAAAVVM